MRAMNSTLVALFFIVALVTLSLAVTYQFGDQGLALITVFGTVAVLGALVAFSLARVNRRHGITVGGVFIEAR